MWLEVRSYPEREAAVSQWLGRGHHLNCVASVKSFALDCNRTCLVTKKVAITCWTPNKTTD